MVDPHLTTPLTRSTRNQHSNCDPIFAELLYHFRQPCVLYGCPCPRPSVGRIQILDPTFTTLSKRSTGNQHSNCGPVFAMCLHRFRQLCVFFWCPTATFAPISGIQSEDPSLTTLISYSTRHQHSSCGPIFAKPLYRFSQLCVFFWCPTTSFTIVPISKIQIVDPP
jgi:hypothetical protein